MVLTNEFVQLNNGKIRIESKPGSGTKVMVSLPK